jgi:hypothetical protein
VRCNYLNYIYSYWKGNKVNDDHRDAASFSGYRQRYVLNVRTDAHLEKGFVWHLVDIRNVDLGSYRRVYCYHRRYYYFRRYLRLSSSCPPRLANARRTTILQSLITCIVASSYTQSHSALSYASALLIAASILIPCSPTSLSYILRSEYPAASNILAPSTSHRLPKGRPHHPSYDSISRHSRAARPNHPVERDTAIFANASSPRIVIICAATRLHSLSSAFQSIGQWQHMRMFIAL